MKSQYVAEDGSVHETAEACESYESVMDKKEVIEAWVSSRYSPRLVKKNTNVIMFWEVDRDKAMAAVSED